MKKRGLKLRDKLGVTVAVIGSTGFIIWGLGISSLGNHTLRVIGGSLVGFAAIFAVFTYFLLRWLK